MPTLDTGVENLPRAVAGLGVKTTLNTNLNTQQNQPPCLQAEVLRRWQRCCVLRHRAGSVQRELKGVMETAEQDWDSPSPLPAPFLVLREISVRLRKAARFLLSRGQSTAAAGRSCDTRFEEPPFLVTFTQHGEPNPS